MKTGAIVVTMLLLGLASEAEARCAQEDLAGRWRAFIMGINQAGLGSVHECPVTSDSAGEFEPTACVGGDDYARQQRARGGQELPA